MPQAERTITINAPVEQVFPVVADGTKATLWRPGIVDVAHVSGEGFGARYTQGVRGPGGRRIAADYEITEFEPNERIAFRAIAGPVRPEGSYMFESIGGGTVLTFKLHAALALWQRLLMGRAVQSSMDAEMDALDRLRDLLAR